VSFLRSEQDTHTPVIGDPYVWEHLLGPDARLCTLDSAFGVAGVPSGEPSAMSRVAAQLSDTGVPLTSGGSAHFQTHGAASDTAADMAATEGYGSSTDVKTEPAPSSSTEATKMQRADAQDSTSKPTRGSSRFRALADFPFAVLAKYVAMNPMVSCNRRLLFSTAAVRCP
jgi:hypothetical protein